MDLNDFLMTVGKVPENQIKYYLIWISKYSAYKNQFQQDNLQDYLDSISENYKDWQVIQAQKAVNMYKYYLAAYSIGKKDIVVKTPISWNEVEAKLKESCKFQHKSYSTEKTCLYWVRTFGRYLENKEPGAVSEIEVKNFLTYLAVQKGLAGSTQKQAFIAILYFFRNVLFKEISNLNDVVRSSSNKKLPIVLTKDEIQLILDQMKGIYKIMIELIYGGGLRLSECLSPTYYYRRNHSR